MVRPYVSEGDLYTILGKIRYIDTHGKIWYEYVISQTVITRYFGPVGIRSEMQQFSSCVGTTSRYETRR